MNPITTRFSVPVSPGTMPSSIASLASGGGASDAAVAWKTGLWYWNTQSGPGTMTPHNAMVNQAGFGQTIRSSNGSLECDGRNPAQVQSRVHAYNRFTSILGVGPGGNLYC